MLPHPGSGKPYLYQWRVWSQGKGGTQRVASWWGEPHIPWSSYRIEGVPTGCKPLLVFLNTKSGPLMGKKIRRRLLRLLNPIQVCFRASAPNNVLGSKSRPSQSVPDARGWKELSTTCLVFVSEVPTELLDAPGRRTSLHLSICCPPGYLIRCSEHRWNAGFSPAAGCAA